MRPFALVLAKGFAGALVSVAGPPTDCPNRGFFPKLVLTALLLIVVSQIKIQLSWQGRPGVAMDSGIITKLGLLPKGYSSSLTIQLSIGQWLAGKFRCGPIPFGKESDDLVFDIAANGDIDEHQSTGCEVGK